MKQELWDAYYPDGTISGKTLVRGDPIPPEYRHAVTEILVLHRDGSVLLTQRDFKKPNYPGYWEVSAGGSVLKGEDFLQGAIRELREETGIAAEDMTPLYRDVTQDTIYQGYLCVTDVDKNSIRLQPGETISFRWVPLAELPEILAGEDCNTNSRGQLNRILDRLWEYI